jgi:hypothetical protein
MTTVPNSLMVRLFGLWVWRCPCYATYPGAFGIDFFGFGPLIGDIRQITSKPNGNAGDLSAEQATKFDSLKGELEGVEKSIQRQAFRRSRAPRAGQQIARHWRPAPR